MTGTSLQVVALGGGHGLAASLKALALLGPQLTAVVTVADDGGSSGRLRKELGAVPPGDLRMALSALAGGDEWSGTWQRLLQHRYTGPGELSGHAVGNLVLSALAEIEGGIVPALDLVGRLVGARGRVLPACCEPLEIVAQVVGADPAAPHEVSEVVGQVAVATTPGSVCALRLDPADPTACPEAVQAVLEADYVVLGPGSWFTSVMPHLLVPDLRDALVKTAARRVVTMNLAPQEGETDGFSPEAHLEALASHAPDLVPDVVLADPDGVLDSRGLMSLVESAGGTLVLAPVAMGDGTPRHHPERLAAAYAEIMGTEGGSAWR
ncbi:MAG TPA: uridine diphosphate-N-acetylglucosamine-binding protein YvcK [Mycobacteriales bacterium]|nr:uridine diphosphate-N-acetylglucosamine-binding protein YvcK [Mycobacteriales bacterium]